MAMDKIAPIAANLNPIRGIGAEAASPAGKPAQEFAQLLKQAMGEANQSQLAADKVALGLATGEEKNIHRAVMAIAQADLNFRYVLQVRNKIIDAYQEIMRMQI